MYLVDSVLIWLSNTPLTPSNGTYPLSSLSRHFITSIFCPATKISLISPACMSDASIQRRPYTPLSFPLKVYFRLSCWSRNFPVCLLCGIPALTCARRLCSTNYQKTCHKCKRCFIACLGTCRFFISICCGSIFWCRKNWFSSGSSLLFLRLLRFVYLGLCRIFVI